MTTNNNAISTYANALSAIYGVNKDSHDGGWHERAEFEVKRILSASTQDDMNWRFEFTMWLINRRTKLKTENQVIESLKRGVEVYPLKKQP